MSIRLSATFEQVTLEYDEAHERVLLEPITKPIFASSTVAIQLSHPT